MEAYNPIELAKKLRPQMIDLGNKKVLIAGLAGTDQAKDMVVHTRIADDLFRAKVYTKASEKELDPFRGEPAQIAASKLTITDDKKNIVVCPEECNSAFLGQINGCNLKCWYCYVDEINKSGNPKFGKYLSAEEYLTRFLIWSKRTQNSTDPDEKLNILRISGGEVFIVPEFIIWIIEAVERFGLQDYIYIWIDCNLATGDFYWRYLTENQRRKISEFRNIGFCVCYKGFDEKNYRENTGAMPEFFHEQFKLHQGLIQEGLDVYSYLYPIAISNENIRNRLRHFITRLATDVDKFAPLRMATPEIRIYGPTQKRLNEKRKKAIEGQWKAMKTYKEEIQILYRETNLSHIRPHEIPAKTA